MKSVLIVTPYRALVGGVETVTETLYQILIRNGFKVEFLTTDTLAPKNYFEKIMVKIFGLPFLTSQAFRRMNHSYYDHVICNGEYGFGVVHPKAIVCFHGSYFGLKKFNYQQLNLKNKLVLSWRGYIQRLGTASKKVVAVSSFLENILKEQHIHTDFVINNPIDLNKFSVQDVAKTGESLFVGRYDYWAKGIDIIEKLVKKNFSIDCLILGSEKNINLKILKSVAHNDLNDVYNQYKFLIFPSRFESFGMVPAEAMACGLAVFMHPVGIGLELRNIIPEYVIDDFLADNELQIKFQKVQSNYLHYSELSRKYVEENFSLDKFEKQWLNVLNA